MNKMDWLFGAKPVSLTLQPDESGKKYSGFHSGKALSCSAKEGETIQAIMDRFNTYRGPDQQITKLWNSDGSILPFSTVLRGSVTAIVKFMV